MLEHWNMQLARVARDQSKRVVLEAAGLSPSCIFLSLKFNAWSCALSARPDLKSLSAITRRIQRPRIAEQHEAWFFP
jgi:hypothetical protein